MSGEAPRADFWLWLGLALAFSPAILDLAAHWRDEAWARSSVLALYFVARGSEGRPADPPRRLQGFAFLAAGLLVQMGALAAGPESLARVGLALGLLGLALLLGRPPLRLALLFLALVPVPFALQRALDPLLRAPLETAAAAVASGLGPATEAAALGLSQGERFLRIHPPDLGLPLMALLAAAAWACASRLQVAPGRALGASIAAGAAGGFGIQLAGLVAAALLLASLGEEPARRFLEQAPPLFAAVLAVGGLELTRRRAERLA